MFNILLLTDHFPPEIGSAAYLFYELGCELTKRGYDVKVLTTFPRYYNLSKPAEKYKKKFLMLEKMDGMGVFRVRGLPIPKDNLLLRGSEQFLLPIILISRGLFLKKPHVIVVYSPPLPLAFISWILSRIKKCKLVVNIQDLYPQTIIDVGMLKNKFLIKIFRGLENFVYTHSDFLTVHSENNKKYLIEHGASEEKVEVVYNWVDIDFIKPLKKLNEFEGIDLKNKFVVSYAGVLSIHQGLDVVIDAAKLLKGKKDIIFLLVGDGFAKVPLAQKIEEHGLSNVIFLPFQPKEKYRVLMACSDVSLVCLRKDVATPVVPGKLMSIMASGRPVIASVPLLNDTVGIVREGNFGVAVEAGDSKALAEAILKFYENPQLIKDFGERGRIYAEKHFSIYRGIDKYENLFNELCIDVKGDGEHG